MKTVGIVQARLGATRLPGKLLHILQDRCVLKWVIDRVRQATCLNEVVVATTTNPADDVLVEHCHRWQVPCFRGSELDVLGRFASAAETFDAELILRINADNPLADPTYLDQLIVAAVGDGGDYWSFRRADGKPVMLTAVSFFAEAISAACLRNAARTIHDPFLREHVTLGVYTRPEEYDIRWLDVPSCCNNPNLRFTLDTQTDLDLLQNVFAALGTRAEWAGAEEVVALAYQHSEWLQAMRQMNRLNPKTKTDSDADQAA